jgi:hypothetical protein
MQREFEEMVQSPEPDHHAPAQRSSERKPIPEWVWLTGTAAGGVFVLLLFALMIPQLRGRLFSVTNKVQGTILGSVQPADGVWEGVGQPSSGSYRISFLVKDGKITYALIRYQFATYASFTTGQYPITQKITIGNGGFTLKEGREFQLTGTFTTPAEAHGSVTLTVRGNPGPRPTPDVTISGPWTARWIGDAEGGK